MATTHPDFTLICTLTADDARYDELEAILISGSNLPGPRANLGLAAAFADCIGAEGATEAQWALLTHWLSMAEDEAPTGSQREFLPFCGVHALGAAYLVVGAERREEIVRRLREVANDGRWRMREGVVLALQRIGEWDFETLMTILETWLPNAPLLELRASVAALAYQPLLRSPQQARRALAVAERAVSAVASADAEARRSPGFAVLKKGLGYAVSLIVAALPEEGFASLERWARSGNPDLIWIVRENLKKRRLSQAFRAEVERVAAALD